jgi:hypothetical protein
LTLQNKMLADKLWENQDRMKNIEKALMFFANCMKGNTNAEEFVRQMPGVEHILSITELPYEEPIKRQKIEDSMSYPQSPLDLGLDEEFIMSPVIKHEEVEKGINLDSSIDLHSDVAEIDKLDFLLDQ